MTTTIMVVVVIMVIMKESRRGQAERNKGKEGSSSKTRMLPTGSEKYMLYATAIQTSKIASQQNQLYVRLFLLLFHWAGAGGGGGQESANPSRIHKGTAPQNKYSRHLERFNSLAIVLLFTNNRHHHPNT